MKARTKNDISEQSPVDCCTDWSEEDLRDFCIASFQHTEHQLENDDDER
jgi:hypothetical protein